MQSKKGSLTEAITNTAIGFVVTLLFSPLIYWICGVTMKPAQMGMVTLLFTAVSVARSYIIRRVFNRIIVIKDQIGKQKLYIRVGNKGHGQTHWKTKKM